MGMMELRRGLMAMAGGSGRDTLKELLDQTITSYEYTGTRTIPYLFDGCTALTEVSFPNATLIDQYMLRNCSALTSISFASATTCAQYALSGCSALSVIHLPELTTGTGSYCMHACGTTTAEGVTIVLPKMQTLVADFFRQCKTKAVDLGAGVSSLPNRCFYATNNTHTYPVIILRKSDAIVTLANSNAITPSNAGESTTKIYVPQSLISSYQSNSNWTTVLARTGVSMEAIEGTIYATHYADGTLIPT